ncbi:MAG: hypothetical protein K9W44_02290 [Candidatus Lokiarchaeota archaeon]|nr:hypothetical protein [Candidatus Harpocratesius repetitus]
MINVQNAFFYHQGLEYKLSWAEPRFHHPVIYHNFGRKLLQYIRFTQSSEFPNNLFNNRYGLRCSSFRIRNLVKDAQKKISLALVSQKHVSLIKINDVRASKAEGIEVLPKMAKIWYEINCQLHDKNPGHEPILQKIMELHQQALASEVPVWTSTFDSITSHRIRPSPYNCIASEEFTGHIDLLLFDEKDQSLIVADYKPEEKFLRSLPQVAIYGLIMKQILNYPKVKCVSFSREKAWIYNPEIIRTVVIEYIKSYGDPQLEWRDLVYSL